MDAKALPARPSLAQYRKQAKDLLHAARAGDPAAAKRLSQCPRVHDHAGAGGHATYALADAQFVIAREHAFDSWPVFASHVERLEHQDPSVAGFEAAADAVISGDESALSQLLRDDRGLIRARSTRAHHATLLHYVAANGVEDFRQRTPANAVAIARLLIEAHAEVDATADSYGGGPSMTTLNLLVSSVHPARAALQVPLAELLLDAGAAIEGVARDGSPLLTALAFRYPDAAEALARRGARVITLLAAAGLGREDLVRRFVMADGAPKPDVALASVPWGRLSRNPQAHLDRALIWAATLGRFGVTKFLSAQRVDLGAKDEQGFTALHWAAFQGHQDVVEVLLHRNAPLEATNNYGGTVLGSTIWASMHVEGVFRAGGFASVDYIPIIERLLAAGARVDAVGFPSGNPAIDGVLARHGARAT
jgi:ankyrin repeat protein